ncbi:MAG TPA: helix-turn-helix domain-containing protein [Bryobacteraceae bacterium]|nr:helix-turn-helix domain-containing protein [Bryobacteraceae bacterium]
MDPKDEAGRLSAIVLDSLDQESGASDLARKAFCSRSSFFRLFQALIAESPATMRRRFLLERAAWQLARTRASVTEIALDAQYASLEAFTRAFGKAFGVSPSLYRRMGATYYHLAAANGFHFWGSGSKGDLKDMDLFDLFAGSDSWHTARLLEHAKSLTDEQLDRPLTGSPRIFPWETADRNLREILDRMVQTKEVWTAALTGRDMVCLTESKPGERDPAAMLARLKKADAEFQSVLSDVQKRGAWSDTFVDALCEPPETFTFGGMFAHVITFNAHRRLLAMDVLRKLGVKLEGFGDPIEYERSLAARPEEVASR